MADKKIAAKGPQARTAKAAAFKAEPKAALKTKPAKAAVRKTATLAADMPQLAAPKEAPQLPSPTMVAAEQVSHAAHAAAEATSRINERTTEMQNQTAQMQNETTQMINDRAQAMFGDMNVRAKETMERSSRMVEEMTDLTRGNVEALVASSKVAARGIETLGQEVAEFSRRSFEEASAVVKNFAEVRSPTDFFRLQSEYARTAFDNVVAESSKMSEAMLKLAGEVAEPITSRYSVTAERVKNIAA